jgi:hypothetical protein
LPGVNGRGRTPEAPRENVNDGVCRSHESSPF